MLSNIEKVDPIFVELVTKVIAPEQAFIFARMTECVQSLRARWAAEPPRTLSRPRAVLQR